MGFGFRVLSQESRSQTSCFHLARALMIVALGGIIGNLGTKKYLSLERVYGLWFMVYGLWFMVYGLWFVV